MKNPFSLSFGKEPTNFIRREQQSNEIIETFSDDAPSYQVCMITGVRGSGKTVMLTDIAKYFRNEKDWVVVDLSAEQDLLRAFVANLYNRSDLMAIFHDAKINLSFLGLGVEVDGVAPITEVSVALGRMLEKLARQKKKVLVTIDEAVCSQTMKEFVSIFQIYLRQELPVYLLMTGLYENIYELQNQKTLTFLYRAPKVALEPLNVGMIATHYQRIFRLSDEEALQMARETKGYSFAFQVLGYLCYKNNTKWTENLPQFEQYLEEYVYDKIWSELSAGDKKVLKGMAEATDTKVESIRKRSGKTSGNFSVYRDRLIKKGIVVATEYGYLDFSLPRFREYVITRN